MMDSFYTKKTQLFPQSEVTQMRMELFVLSNSKFDISSLSLVFILDVAATVGGGVICQSSLVQLGGRHANRRGRKLPGTFE